MIMLLNISNLNGVPIDPSIARNILLRMAVGVDILESERQQLNSQQIRAKIVPVNEPLVGVDIVF